MQLGISFRSLSQPALLGVTLLLFRASSPAQENPSAKRAVMPDAQVEANVLKALASAEQLSDEHIMTSTVYGVVTLSGSVPDETTRVLAENLASHAAGVSKVIDELTLGTPAATGQQPSAAAGTNPDLQSDGTKALGTQDNQQPTPPPVQSPAPVARQAPAPSPPYRQPYGVRYATADPPYGAQQGGIPVTIPSGAMVRVRMNQGLDSRHAQPGSVFDATALNDVVADGAVAIPRGATLQGAVVDFKAAGALKGRGELYLQLTSVTLGGKVFSIVSDEWSTVGIDKTIHTFNSAVGLGAVGAVIGAVAGGGQGAAIGAGVGGVTGIATSAASGGGQALIPPEAILTFHLEQPAKVATVSQAEMDRLGYGVPVRSPPRLVPRPAPAYYGYYGPGYYPARPYPAYYPYPY